MHHKVVYEDMKRILFHQHCLLKLIFKKCCSLIALPYTQKWNTIVMWHWQWFLCIRMSPNLEVFKGTCHLCSKALLVSFPYWNVGGESSKICRQQISVPTTIKKMSVARFCGHGSLFNGLHSWQTTNPNQIHKTTTSQK